MTSTTNKRSPTDVAANAKRRRVKRKLPTLQEEQQLRDGSSSSYNDICTYWAANLTFDPQRVLLRRPFFINANKTNNVSVGFYPARDYDPLLEFGVIRSCGSKSIILTDKQVYTLAQCLPTITDSMCKEGEDGKTVIKCDSGIFLLSTCCYVYIPLPTPLPAQQQQRVSAYKWAWVKPYSYVSVT